MRYWDLCICSTAQITTGTRLQQETSNKSDHSQAIQGCIILALMQSRCGLLVASLGSCPAGISEGRVVYAVLQLPEKDNNRMYRLQFFSLNPIPLHFVARTYG